MLDKEFVCMSTTLHIHACMCKYFSFQPFALVIHAASVRDQSANELTLHGGERSSTPDIYQLKGCSGKDTADT